MSENRGIPKNNANFRGLLFEQLQHCPIAKVKGLTRCRRVEKLDNLSLAANSGQSLPELWAFKDGGQIVFDKAGKLAEPQEHSYSYQRTLNRAFAFLLLSEDSQVVLDKGWLYLPYLVDFVGFTVFQKASQVTAVGQNSVLGQTRLDSQIIQKALEVLP